MRISEGDLESIYFLWSWRVVNGGGGEGRRGDLANGNFYKFLLPLNLGHCLPGPGWPALTQFTFNQAAQPEDRRGLERTGEKDNKYFASLYWICRSLQLHGWGGRKSIKTANNWSSSYCHRHSHHHLTVCLRDLVKGVTPAAFKSFLYVLLFQFHLPLSTPRWQILGFKCFYCS